MMKVTFTHLTLFLGSYFLCSCGLELERYDDPEIPLTITVPPVENKYKALQGVFEAINGSVRDQFQCAFKSKQISEDQTGQSVIFADGDYVVTTDLIASFLSLPLLSFRREFHTSIKFDNHHANSAIRWVSNATTNKPDKNWVPGDCNVFATINTVDFNRFHIEQISVNTNKLQESIELTTNISDRKIEEFRTKKLDIKRVFQLMDHGVHGVYFGEYEISWEEHQEDPNKDPILHKYRINFGDPGNKENKGFYYSKFIVDTPEETLTKDNIGYSIFNLTYVGRVEICNMTDRSSCDAKNTQLYNFQDIFLQHYDKEDLTKNICDDHWIQNEFKTDRLRYGCDE